VLCLTVLTSKINGFRHKSAAHVTKSRVFSLLATSLMNLNLNLSDHGKRQNSWQTPKFTVFVDSVNSRFSSIVLPVMVAF